MQSVLPNPSVLLRSDEARMRRRPRSGNIRRMDALLTVAEMERALRVDTQTVYTCWPPRLRADPGQRPMKMADPRALGRLPDGTEYFAPLGELVYAGEDRVQCHLCGRFMRKVGGPHLLVGHGWTLEQVVARHAGWRRTSVRTTLSVMT